MRIAFYWDIFWLLNFIMNLFLLGMTAIMRRKYLRKWRLIGVSLLESGQMTAVLVWWLQQLKEHNGKNEILFWQNGMPAGLIMLEILFAFEMLQFCFWEKQFRELLKDLLYFLQVSVLTGYYAESGWEKSILQEYGHCLQERPGYGWCFILWNVICGRGIKG